MYKYDYAVFIGRLQPLHSGHHHVVKEALKLSRRVIIVVGSSFRPRDFRNPFTFQERSEIISTAFDQEDLSRIDVIPQVDYTYNDEKWIASIQSSVMATVAHHGWIDKPKICIVGYDKDHSTYYLKKFPLWDMLEITPINKFNATDIRMGLFSPHWKLYFEWFVNPVHEATVCRIAKRDDAVRKELLHIIDYKKQWQNSPYPPTFNTVDAVVTQSGHILLVKRGAMPGEGLWALPGGFIHVDETLREAMVRELYEETGLAVPKPVILGSINKEHTYDEPNRSVRGRTISQAFHIRLADREELPKIKGADDVVDARWFSLSDFMTMREQLFEDHFNIVEHMLGM